MDHAEAVRIQATEKYMVGSLSGPTLEAFESHFFDCDICAEDVRTAVFLVDNASAEFRTEAVSLPARIQKGKRENSWRDWFRLDFRQPAFVLPMLALLAVSALWVGDHRRLSGALSEASAPQMITNVPLDTARGEKPVSVTKDERYFAVSFYIDQDSQSSYAIRISGNGVEPTTVLAAARSTAYSILLPVARYTAGRYDFQIFGGTIDGPRVKQFSLSLE